MLTKVSDVVAPYLIWIKIVAVAAVVGGLVWFGYNEKAIRDDREKFKTEAKQQKETAEQYARQISSNIQFTREVVDAVKSLKVQSNTYIDSIEVSPPPGDDGDTVVLVAAGVPKAVPRLPGYNNYSANRTTAGTP
jgi:hypothetical protein